LGTALGSTGATLWPAGALWATLKTGTTIPRVRALTALTPVLSLRGPFAAGPEGSRAGPGAGASTSTTASGAI
jgi:hypothetical protein